MPSLQHTLINLDHVWLQYDKRPILHDICLQVNKGDFIAITGPNGGGKTTLLRIILRLLKPTKGTVQYFQNSHPTDRLPIGYLPQKTSIDSRFPILVQEVIASGLLVAKHLSRTQKKELIDDTISLMGLEQHAMHSIGELSGGQLQRTLLGRAIISRPEILILDEPLSYVDKHFEHQLYDLIAQLAKDTTILLVSHDMSTISGMADRHIIIDHKLHECAAQHHFTHSECD